MYLVMEFFRIMRLIYMQLRLDSYYQTYCSLSSVEKDIIGSRNLEPSDQDSSVG